MHQYRNRMSGVVVHAMQLTSENAYEVARWAGNALVVEEIDPLTREKSPGLNVRGSKEMLRASEGMYVIKVEDHFFVARPTSFENRFERVDEPSEVTRVLNARERKIMKETEK